MDREGDRSIFSILLEVIQSLFQHLIENTHGVLTQLNHPEVRPWVECLLTGIVVGLTWSSTEYLSFCTFSTCGAA